MVKIILVNKMNENNELLMHIYKSAEMGVYSTTGLINALKNKDNKIKHVLECELKGYEKFMKESEGILIKQKLTPKKSGIITKMGNDMGIMYETMKDNSDAAIASMLVEGFTMGVIEMETKYNQYKNIAKRDVLNMALDFKKFQENEIEKLKTFM